MAGDRTTKDIHRELYEARNGVYAMALGRWPDILAALGVDRTFLRPKKGQPCPFCREGRDRYSWIDKRGDGFHLCRHCGAGDGVDFLRKYHSWSWWQATGEVLAYFSDPANHRLEAELEERIARIRQYHSQSDVERRRARLQAVWRGAARVVAGDPVHRWLSYRVPGLREVPNVIRLHPALDYYREPAVDMGEPDKPVLVGQYPAMVAAVQGPDDKVVNVHRTYLTEDGQKATIVDPWGEVLDSRKLMRGLGVVGGAIRLVPGRHRELGGAEGIETAFSAMAITGIPTWALISTSGVQGFRIPEWVECFTAFADNDVPDQKGRRPGFDAVDRLLERPDVKDRVNRRTLRVNVRTTAKRGTDFADLGRKIAGEPPMRNA